MVQVDVFWSYGLGAGFAMANTRRLQVQQAEHKSVYDHTSFRDALLYLACIFVPSGAFLIWAFPSWETMHVGSRDIPGWLVAAFTATNTTQGILGFAVASSLLRRKRPYAAYLQWVLAYFAMFIVLVHGWDGTGYQRFFSSTRDELANWNWYSILHFLAGDVARSLIIMSSVVVPVMAWMMARDLKRGYALENAPGDRVRAADAARVGIVGLAVSVVAALLVGSLGGAILASMAIRYLGAIVGVAVFAAAGYFIAVRPGGLFYRHFRSVVYAEPFFAQVMGDVVARNRPAGSLDRA